MEKIYIVTNIILDWLGMRHPFFIWAKEIFRKTENNEIQLLVNWIWGGAPCLYMSPFQGLVPRGANDMYLF